MEFSRESNNRISWIKVKFCQVRLALVLLAWLENLWDFWDFLSLQKKWEVILAVVCEFDFSDVYSVVSKVVVNYIRISITDNVESEYFSVIV